MAGAVNVQVTIDAKDNGAAAQLLALKQAAGQLGVAFNVATASSAKLGASGKGLGRDFSGAFAGAIEGATGLRTVLAQVAIGYEAIHAARAFLTEGFTATSGLEQARLGIGAEVAASSTITDPSGKAIEGQEKLALATALADTEMRGLQADAARVGIEATALAGIFTKAVAPAIRGSSTDVATTLANLRSETTQLAVLARELGIPYEQVESTLLQILNGHAQQRNQLVAILGITQADLKAAKERNDIQGLLNAKLAAYKPGDASTNLRGIEGQFKESLERGAEDAVAPIVTVIEQKIGPAFSKLDLSGLSRAIQAITTQVGTVFGQMFDEAVKGAQALAGWLDQNRDKVQAVVADTIALASQIGTALAAAVKLAAAFVQVGLSSGIIGGAVRAMADLLTLAAKFAPEIAAAFAVSKIVGFIGALNTMSGAALATAAKFGAFVTSLNAAGQASGLLGTSLRTVALGRLGVEGAAAAEGITVAGVAAGVATGTFLTLAGVLTGVAIVLGGIALAWEIHRQNVARARAEQEAANRALGESIRLAPELIAQLHAEEETLKGTAAGTSLHREAQEAVNATKAKLIALSPSFQGAISDETASIDAQTAALNKNIAALQAQAQERVRAAELRVIAAQQKVQDAEGTPSIAAAAATGAAGVLGPAAGNFAGNLEQNREIAAAKEEQKQAIADLNKAKTDLAPAAPDLPSLDAVIKQMAADTAEVKRQHKAGLLDEKTYQNDLAQIQFDGLEKQIAIRQKAMELESDPFRRKQEQDQITALRQQQAGTATFTRTPPEPVPGTDRKEQGQREAEAAAQRSIIAEQMRIDKQDTEDLYKQKLISAEQYYTKLAAIEYNGLQKEVAIDEQLLQTETDPKKRTELLAQITNLNAQALEATKHTTALEIEALDELQKKRIETARTSISEGETGVRDTLSARVADVHAQVDVGTVTKAEGAQQLATAYADALVQLRALYSQAVAFAEITGDPKDVIAVEKIATAYNQTIIEAKKATDASTEFGKALGESLGRSFDQFFGGGIDKMRSFSATMKEMAIGLVKDLQHAFAAPIGVKIKEGIEHALAPKPKGDTTPLGTAPDVLFDAGKAMQAAADRWMAIAVMLNRINPSGPAAPAGAQRGNLTQSGATPPPGSPAALSAPSVTPDLGMLGSDAGVGALPSAAAPDAAVPYAGGTGGPSQAQSIAGVLGTASGIASKLGFSPVPGTQTALGLASSIAQKAAGIPTPGGVAGAIGGGTSGSGALSAAASALRSVASALSNAASQLTQSAQQLTQAASALSSSGSGGGGGGGEGGIMSLFSGGGGGAGGAAGLGDLAAAAAAQGGHVTQRGVLRLWQGGAVEHPRREGMPFSPALRAAAGILALAAGGHVWGAGTATSDSIPAMLSKGEYVVNAASVQRVGVPAMHAINAGKFTRDSHNTIRHFAEGGLVSGSAGNAARGGEHHVVELRPPDGWVAKEMESAAGQDAHVRISTRNARSIKAGMGIA